MKIKKNIHQHILFILAVCWMALVPGMGHAQEDGFSAFSRQDYYTDETTGEIMVFVPHSGMGNDYKVDFVRDFSFLVRNFPVYPGETISVPFKLEGFVAGDHEITVSIYENEKWVDSRKVNFVIRQAPAHAVKIDLASGGLIVDGLPFFPFGFYSDWPIDLASLDEEAARGFNLISPYWKIEKKSLKQRKAFMDRCAALGIKVNYNVCSVAGGGGVHASRGDAMSRDQKEKLLRKEIETFRNHPALLAWYIADEPEGQGVPPDSLLQTYRLIKEIDPWHPLSIVFMAPSVASDYAAVMDIAMTDPYPVPQDPVTMAGDYTRILYEQFARQKPVWTVPQAFGGNEWWTREPSRDELRAMTYLSLVNHASGIQYFMRMAPNGRPKSAALWGEAGALALEAAELAPHLLSGYPSPKLEVLSPQVQVRALNINGIITILAVNSLNSPVIGHIRLTEFDMTGEAEVMFENRKVPVTAGIIEEMIEPYGTRAYRIDARKKTMRVLGARRDNLTIDPGFEETALAGVPSSCYFRTGEDKGSTCFTDTRVAYHGERSIRLNNPSDREGLTLTFFPVEPEQDQSCTVSIWGKTMKSPMEDSPLEFELGLGPEISKTFTLGPDWTEFAFSTAGLPLTGKGPTGFTPVLRLKGAGTAWFDLIQVFPDLSITSKPVRDQAIEIVLKSAHPAAGIRYTLDGSDPDPGSPTYDAPLIIGRDAIFKAAAFENGLLKGYVIRSFSIHKAIGKTVTYDQPFQKYTGGGSIALVDGLVGSNHFKDGKWQGFNGNDAEFTVDLGELTLVTNIWISFLQDFNVWIFLPEFVEFWASADGSDFELLGRIDTGIPQDKPGAFIENYRFSGQKNARYLKVVAKNTGICPPWHKGAGGKAWVFTDELIVE